ncbi:MAG: hypothetical protein J6Y74_00115 [Clostridia bacterium]|nr:hypothetical protein [Clostridia bacterium]
MVYYVLAVLISIVLYALGLVFMKYLVKYRKFSDVDFPFGIFVLYFIELVLLLVEAGVEHWNDLTLLPLGNIGPFMFFTLPFLFLLPKRIRKYYLTLVVLLSPAMLIYGLFDGILLVISGRQAYATYVIDIFAHTLFAVYGVYLVRSGQVDFEVKRSLISGSIILAVALLMLVLNAIFRTSFFGLSLYGEHNIYGIILLKSAALSVILYFLIVSVALVVGYFFGKYLSLALDALERPSAEDAPAEEEEE